MMVVLYSIFSVQKSTCFIVSAVSCRPPSVDPGLGSLAMTGGSAFTGGDERES
jgi:hypothetical protein